MNDLDSMRLEGTIEDSKAHKNFTELGNNLHHYGRETYNRCDIQEAIIANPYLKPSEGYDPREITDHINPNTGKCCLSWLKSIGGVSGPPSMQGTTEKNPEGQSLNPRESTHTGLRTTSTQQLVKLLSPAIWTSNSNWCGMYYFPPVGSQVITSANGTGQVYPIGYIPSNYAAIKPIVKPGETIIKGFGENYIHLRTSDKLDLYAKATEGGIDYDDAYKKKTNAQSSTLIVSLNANDDTITISAGGKNGASVLTMTSSYVTITTDVFTVRAKSQIVMQAPNIQQGK